MTRKEYYKKNTLPNHIVLNMRVGLGYVMVSKFLGNHLIEILKNLAHETFKFIKKVSM